MACSISKSVSGGRSEGQEPDPGLAHWNPAEGQGRMDRMRSFMDRMISNR